MFAGVNATETTVTSKEWSPRSPTFMTQLGISKQPVASMLVESHSSLLSDSLHRRRGRCPFLEMFSQAGCGVFPHIWLKIAVLNYIPSHCKLANTYFWWLNFHLFVHKAIFKPPCLMVSCPHLHDYLNHSSPNWKLWNCVKNHQFSH